MSTTAVFHKRKIKSPLNYIGGKYKILDQLLPLFPPDIDNFVDLFTGGCNVGINATAKKTYCNDNLIFLVEMYRAFQVHAIEEVLFHIEKRIFDFELSLVNEAGYKKLRETYNREKHPLDLFVLIAYSFNHQIRFNNNHQFNNPFGRERSSFNQTMKQNLEIFLHRIKNTEIEFTAHNFREFDFSAFGANDFVYCDPPYLISTGTYNDGKRGFTGWNKDEENALLEILDRLNERRIKFALSNVLEHKGKSNEILKQWLEKNPDYRVNFIKHHYSNSNYQTANRDKNASSEVLITNYETLDRTAHRTLFDLF